MRVPVFDPAPAEAPIAGELAQAVSRVARSGRFILGPEVEAFEEAVARFIGVKFAVGVSSGTDALTVALLALGLEPGDEVITTPLSFFATAEVIVRLGAVPRFTDINPTTFNMEVSGIDALIGPRTKAILPVHLYGQPADLRALGELAARRGVPVVEDAAQAFGAALCGRRAGAWGTLACFSFFPTKPLGGWGDGGMVVTSDAALAERCRRLRAHGSIGKHEHALLGGNFRLDALQAAVLGVKLRYVDEWREARREIAEEYTAALGASLEAAAVTTPAVADGASHAWALYTLRSARRDALVRALAAAEIATAVHYPKPLYAQPALAHLGVPAGACPEAERAAREVVSLPMYPGLDRAARERVVGAVRGAL